MILRAARPRDAAQIAAIYAPHVLSGIVTFETEVPDAAAMAARMAGSNGLYPWIVATAEAGDDQLLGYACAFRFRERAAYRWVVETSIYVAERAQGRGVGGPLYRALLATLTAQGFAAAIGVIALPNPASVALHERLGFRLAGMFPDIGYKHEQWIPVGYWRRDLADRAVPAAEPRPFTATGLVHG